MRKRDFWLLLASVLAAGVLSLTQFLGSAVTTGAWGLSFQQPGQPPVGPAGQDVLRRYDSTYLGNTEEKVLYLTFDAGYENGCTGKILDTLAKHRVPAAFFLVGNYLEKNPDLVRRMVEEGHIVGNHTMHHPDMSKLTDKTAFAGELQGMEELFRSVTGKELPKFYRPPQGIYSQDNLKMAQELGLGP